MAQRSSESRSNRGIGGVQQSQEQVMLLEAEVEVGELDSFTCEAPQSDIIVQPEDC